MIDFILGMTCLFVAECVIFLPLYLKWREKEPIKDRIAWEFTRYIANMDILALSQETKNWLILAVPAEKTEKTLKYLKKHNKRMEQAIRNFNL